MTNESKAARFQRASRRARLRALLAAAAVLVLLAIPAVTGSLRDGLTAWLGPASAAGEAPWIVTALMAMLVAVGLEAAVLPFELERIHRLERRYGLTRTSARLSVVTQVRSAILTTAALVGAALLLRACAALGPERWWLLAIPGLAAVVGAVVPIASHCLPGGHQHDEQVLEPALAERLRRLIDGAGVGPVGIAVCRVSHWTSRVWARGSGLGRWRRVQLTDTLLEGMSDDEIEAVVAHELAHHAHGDLWKGAVAHAIAWGLAAGVAAIVVARWVERGWVRGAGDPAAFPVVVLTAGLVWLALLPLLRAWARRGERRADAYALRVTGKPLAMERALQRVAARNLVDPDPPGWWAALASSHPPLGERLARLRPGPATPAATGRGR